MKHMTTQLPGTQYTLDDLREIAYRGSYDDMQRSLARALLAAYEQEPVYLVPIDDEPGRSRRLWLEAPATNWLAKAFYTHPAPSIPAGLPPEIARNDTDGWWMYKGARVGGGAAEWYNKALADAKALVCQPIPAAVPEDVLSLFLRAKALMYQSGGTPIENSLNPIDAWLYDAESAAMLQGQKS